MDHVAEKELPKRKDIRLKGYDYSSKGYYFITVCIKDRKQILSDIVKPVGVGAHDDPQIRLTRVGEIVEKYLLSSEKMSGVIIDRYVIMPDHLHAIIFLDPDKYAMHQNGSSRAPTPTNNMLPHVVSVFKRLCGKELGENIFQRGYFEHVIRDQKDYEASIRYIYENPLHWYYGKSHTNECLPDIL